jgi:Outer membrane protein beta-barrel domain
MRKLVAVVFGCLLFAASASAQDRPVSINVGAGPLIPLGGFKDAFNTGFLGGIGATFNLSPTLGVQAEYNYNWMPGPEKTIIVADNPGGLNPSNQLIESNHNMHTLTFNVVYTAPKGSSKVGGYGLGGLGYYHRTVQLTSPAVGYGTFCDPYWYVCYPTLVPIDTILVDRSSNDFGINFGGGITFGGEAAKFYVEIRYHYVWGPEVQAQAPVVSGGPCQTEACSTNAQYMPITFGVRW